MPRQKKVQEVPIETINAINSALVNAMVSLDEMSYAQVRRLDETVREQISMAAQSLDTAIKVFNRAYINKPAPRPAPVRKNTLKPLRKPKVQAVLEEGQDNEK